MASNPHHYWTVEAYLEYEQEQGMKYEYIDGKIYAMSGGTDNHSYIAVNCMTALRIQTRGSSCRVHNSEMKVKIREKKFVYPDFSVVCGEPQYADEKRTQLINPTLVAEVTSDSSEAYDKGTKSTYYRQLSSLQYYLIVDQKQVEVQLLTRQNEGWFLQDFTDMSDIVSLPMFSVTLPLETIYEDIIFN